MTVEIERKYRIATSVAAVREALHELTGREPEETLQRDEYFDRADQSVSNADMTVRLRIVGQNAYLALKGPRLFSQSGTYSRIELEFEAKSEALAREEIQRRGLVLVAVIEKRRSEYRVGSCVVAIDTLPIIGSFIEIEGPSEPDIEDVRRRLPAVGNPTAENYSELLRREYKTASDAALTVLRAEFWSEVL